jgi:hypothetical protein
VCPPKTTSREGGVKDERVRDLVASVDDACAARRWPEVASLAVGLAASLPPRLGLLARSMIDFVSEGEVDLAAHVWAHLRDAIDGGARA